ncbi:MAG: 3-phosphoshikimate 1-carboxyvinyltransferase [Candidatus Bathyarchaeia archaeon]
MAVVRKSSVEGVVNAPPSKSQTHRFYIAAMLSPGESIVEQPSICLDTKATLNAIRLMGCTVSVGKSAVRILSDGTPKPPKDIVNCHGSGTTLRILTAVSSIAPGITVLTGNKSLKRRPMLPLLNALDMLGVKCYSATGGRPPIIIIGGTIRAGCVEIGGDLSSQYISGLLFTLAKVDGKSTIRLTTPLVSKPYVDMTIEVLRMCGVDVYVSEDYRLFELNGPSIFKPFRSTIEGDYSSAAAFIVAATISGGRVRINNLRMDSLQADKVVLDVVKSVGCRVESGEKYVTIEGASDGLEPFEFDAANSPDLVPLLAVLASSCKGVSVIKSISRLRFKESDRVSALTSQLSKMGVKIEIHEDHLKVYGSQKIKGAVINPYGDHRIAMACAVMALKAEGETVIKDALCVKKSYPDFFTELAKIGARLELRKSL